MPLKSVLKHFKIIFKYLTVYEFDFFCSLLIAGGANRSLGERKSLPKE